MIIDRSFDELSREERLQRLLEYLDLEDSTENFFYVWFRCSPSYICLNRYTGMGYDHFYEEMVDVTLSDWDCGYELGVSVEFSMDLALQIEVTAEYDYMYFKYTQSLV